METFGLDSGRNCNSKNTIYLSCSHEKFITFNCFVGLTTKAFKDMIQGLKSGALGTYTCTVNNDDFIVINETSDKTLIRVRINNINTSFHIDVTQLEAVYDEFFFNIVLGNDQYEGAK